MTTKDVGDRVSVRYLAYAAGVASTATVALTVTDPDGVTSTPTVTLTAPNQYDASFTLTSAGSWSWRWDVTGLVIDKQYGAVTAMSPAPPTYCTLALLKEALGISATDTTRDSLLIQALVGASRSVEQYCDGRRFYLDLTSSARTFPTRRVIQTCDGQRLPIDDIGHATMTVEFGDGTTWTTTTAYETYPANALVKGQAITALLTTPAATTWTANRRVRVTAKWGWPEIPAAVEQATLLQASRLFRRKDSPEGVAGSADWGLVRVPNMDPDVKALLAYLTTPFQAA